MVVRLGAAIGAGMIFVCSSVAISATESKNWNAIASGPTIVGTASTYNPYRHDRPSGGPATASGELYDPTAWTAAIHIDLRKEFGGVYFGKDYRPAYALVASSDKQGDRQDQRCRTTRAWSYHRSQRTNNALFRSVFETRLDPSCQGHALARRRLGTRTNCDKRLIIDALLSALGQKRTLTRLIGMSALPPKADIPRC